ncbi:hypothetical protein G6O69_02535 [Pseudenhygromyxa sp. WMMC2535]|uniref:hypothetical protein n=1 Tax=Pseudenhygromyxa sp. WMMC2535 TaxID=2712867 RepID=UPI00159518E4|nr:hypothetical protein [Pseudenhygromyxa sp. WMMC2535]NVB36692.1 hypothetical protein [Pseudenhygromyxa sp. WMMC2535]
MNDNDGWLGRILFDARDRALHTSRGAAVALRRQVELQHAELQAQALELDAQRQRARAAEAQLRGVSSQLDELERQLEGLGEELRSAQAAVSVLREEYGRAAVRNKRLETRIVGLLRRLFGGEAAPLLIDLLAPTGLDTIEHHSERERHLLHLLELDRGEAEREPTQALASASTHAPPHLPARR